MKPGRILIVEDDESIRESVREILEMEGYEVETAQHGRQALEKLGANPALPALILLDLNMPVLSGQEFLARLPQIDARWTAIPVLLMTAVPDAQISGVAGTLRKPIELEEILVQVSAVLK